MSSSILHPEFRGVVFVAGQRGAGKTYFMAQAEDPELIAFFDLDSKGEGLHNQVNFGAYYPITTMAAGRGGVALWQEFQKAIMDLPTGKFTTAIIDNVSPLELGMNAEVMRDARGYARRYGMVQSNIEGGQYGGGKGAVNYMIGEMITAPLQAKGIKLIEVSAHVKPDFKIYGKFNVKGADRWAELSILTLVITRPDDPPVPSAIVLKEALGRMTYNREARQWEIMRRLPLRLPQATWAAVKYYLDHPADLRNPAAGEVPSQMESDAYSAELSREQLSYLLESARADAAISTLALQEATLPAANPVVDAIKLYLINHGQAENAEIMQNVQGATLPLVLKAKLNK